MEDRNEEERIEEGRSAEARHQLDNPSAPARPVALISGGSRGIGLATARLLGQRGYRLVITARQTDSLSEAAASLRLQNPDVEAVAADLGEQTEIEALLACVEERCGRLDVLVNNAGGSHHGLPLEELSTDDWDRTLRQNLTIAARMSAAALPLLKRSTAGSIVNVASLAGRQHSLVASCDYAAAKAGLIGLTRQLALELAPARIRVNAVAPGLTATARVAARWQALPEEERRRHLHRIPLARPGKAEEIAAAIAFLASDEASYITGACLDVNGGAFMG